MNIPLLNLKQQYENLRAELEPAVLAALNSCAHVMGPKVHEFEEAMQDFLEVKHAMGCANGTDALQIALMAIGIKPGDEVITTPFTFIATAEMIHILGAKPVFVDIDPNTYNIDPEKIEEKITDKTKAILVVHLYGQCCDMNHIMQIAQKHNLRVIEDTAQAVGAWCTVNGEKKFAGTIGDIGTFSFYPTKNLGCAGDGGMISCNDDELAAEIRKIRAHGSDKRYYHDITGVNSRLDEIQATILLVKLKYINEWNAHRNRVSEIYDEAFKSTGITAPYNPGKEDNSSYHVYHQYTIRIKAGTSRDELRDQLRESGIASEVYYPVPLHMQKVFEFLGHKPEDFPETLKASEEILCLPIYAELSEEDAKQVTSTISIILESQKVSV